MSNKKVVITKKDLKSIINEEVSLWKARKLLEQKDKTHLTEEHIEILERMASLDERLNEALEPFRKTLSG